MSRNGSQTPREMSGAAGHTSGAAAAQVVSARRRARATEGDLSPRPAVWPGSPG